MQNSYPPDVSDFVRFKISQGRFATESDLVVEALRFYRDVEQQREQLGSELREAAASLDRGEGVEVDMDEIREIIRQRYESS